MKNAALILLSPLFLVGMTLSAQAQGASTRDLELNSQERMLVLSKYSADRHFDSMSGSRIDLRCGTMVEAQHSAESLGAPDRAECRFGAVGRLD